jgi:probable addiction module killer protein
VIAQGHFGDYKQISNNVFELRFFFGPGYRVYYTIQNDKVVILLNGGDKGSQNKDIESAQSLADALEN